jgi:hypothetical protein
MAVLWVVGIFFVKDGSCLAAERVRDETGAGLKRYLTIEQYRLSERLQLD